MDESSPDTTDNRDDKPADATPSGGKVIVRSMLAIIGGILVMMLCVVLYQVLFLMLPWYLSDPDEFRELMELMQDPERMKQAVDSGEYPIPSNPALAFSLVMDVLCSVAGGCCAAWIAARAKFQHAIALAVIMTLWSITNAATNEMEQALPLWVPWGRSLFCIPVGIVLGGWLRTKCCRKK